MVNVTKVIPARLTGVRRRAGADGAKIEITLTERLGPVDWKCFLKPAKRVKDGDRIEFSGEVGGEFGDVAAVVRSRDGGAAQLVRRTADRMEPVLAELGTMPLPPYIAGKRAPDGQDNADYQTLFAREEGAVAAPTAGLHFTPELVAALQATGVTLHEVTLHVGPGTFLPVKVDAVKDHKMHGEWGRVTAQTAAALNAARKAGAALSGRHHLAAMLESAAQDNGTIAPFEAVTDIFITPGYRFRAADMLVTNFHLPRSTLFMLVSAFCGFERMQAAYAHAIAEGYRFYSYGDGSLLERAAQ